MNREYIDIGLNLTSKHFPNPRKIIEEAKKDHIVSLILTGTTYQNSIKSIKICSDESLMRIYCTAGVHPHNAKEWTEHSYQRFKDLIQLNGQIVAVGECGLDYDRKFSTPEQQIKCFTDQIRLARELDMPLFLHDRGAFNDFYDIINMENKEFPVKGVVHCFTSGYDELISYLDLGMYIGITGWICDDRRNHGLIDAIKKINNNHELRKLFLNRVMIETDAPFLSPIPGVRPNHPRYISYVLEKLANEISISPDELALLCYSNTVDFFEIKDNPSSSDQVKDTTTTNKLLTPSSTNLSSDKRAGLPANRKVETPDISVKSTDTKDDKVDNKVNDNIKILSYLDAVKGVK